MRPSVVANQQLPRTKPATADPTEQEDKADMANPGTLTVRVRGVPFPIEFADWTHDRLYHTVEFEGGDAQIIQTFIGAAGSPIPGGSRVLTIVDTNIPRSGDTGLQEGWEMLIYSIQLQVVREMGRNAAQQAFAMQDITNVGRARRSSRATSTSVGTTRPTRSAACCSTSCGRPTTASR